jgi:hypothetical protein
MTNKGNTLFLDLSADRSDEVIGEKKDSLMCRETVCQIVNSDIKSLYSFLVLLQKSAYYYHLLAVIRQHSCFVVEIYRHYLIYNIKFLSTYKSDC